MYLIREIVDFVVFERQTIEVFDWCSRSIVFNFSESEAFDGVVLVLGDMSFLIILSFVWTSDLFSRLTLKISIFYRCFSWEKKKISDWLTNRRSFRILLIPFDASANQIHPSTSVGRVSLRGIRFWLVIQLNHNIDTWLIKGLSPRFVGEILFSLQPKQKTTTWSFNPTGGEEVS